MGNTHARWGYKFMAIEWRKHKVSFNFPSFKLVTVSKKKIPVLILIYKTRWHPFSGHFVVKFSSERSTVAVYSGSYFSARLLHSLASLFSLPRLVLPNLAVSTPVPLSGLCTVCLLHIALIVIVAIAFYRALMLCVSSHAYKFCPVVLTFVFECK
jgi:hypothetical protein